MRSRLPHRRRLRRTRLSLTLARLRRSSVVAVVAATTAGLASATVASDALSAAHAAERRWGETILVDVIIRPVEAGHGIVPADVRRERRPRALLPDGMIVDATGLVALVPLGVGDVVTPNRAAADLMPAGWRGVAVPPPGTGGHPDVRLGDRVEVVDVAEGASGGVMAGGVVVAVRASDGAVTVAVPAGAAGAVAYAAVAGSAVLVLTAAPPPR